MSSTLLWLVICSVPLDNSELNSLDKLDLTLRPNRFLKKLFNCMLVGKFLFAAIPNELSSNYNIIDSPNLLKYLGLQKLM